MNKKTHGIVSISKCCDYLFSSVKECLITILEPFGGMSRFVLPGNRVHIKPNLLAPKSPENAITTHPVVVEAVVDLVKQAGGVPVIGDSPGGAFQGIEQYWEKTGLSDVSKRTGAALISLEREGVIAKKIPGRTYYLSKKVLEADVVINLPKLKTHDLVLMTGAIKNMLGVVPGLQKPLLHRDEPKPHRFCEVLVDVYSLVRPRLTIMDAVIGMEGNGPSGGNPKTIGFLAASPDAVALDSVAAAIIGFQPKEIATNTIAHNRGLGCADLSNINVIGAKINDLKVDDFKLPSNRLIEMMPDALMRLGRGLFWSRPLPNHQKCSQCGLCEQSCPVSAIRRKEGFPIIDYNVCINCLCCDEICPDQAIEIEKSWLARKFM